MRRLYARKLAYQPEDMKKWLPPITIGIIYLCLAVWLMNPSLVGLTVFGDYPLTYKSKLLFDLAVGMSSVMPPFSLGVLVLTAVLVGIDLTLITTRVARLKSQPGTRWVAGGGSVLGIAGSGCAACGLPVLSVFGLSGGALGLPFHGQEISLLALSMLLLSLFFLLKSGPRSNSCILPQEEPSP